MKKSLVLSFLAVAALGFTSCKKDWTCNCKINGKDHPIEMKNVKKADAKTACSAWDKMGYSDCKLN